MATSQSVLITDIERGVILSALHLTLEPFLAVHKAPGWEKPFPEIDPETTWDEVESVYRRFLRGPWEAVKKV